MRHLLTLALLLCAAMSALYAPAAPVNPTDWVGPMVNPDGWYQKMSADGKAAVFVGFDDEISVMDLYKQQVIARFRAEPTYHAIYSPHSGEGNTQPFAISDHGEWVAQAQRSLVYLWSCNKKNPVITIATDAVVTSVMFVPNQPRLLVATLDGQLQEYECRTAKRLRKRQNTQPVYRMTALRSAGLWAGFASTHSLVIVNPKDLSTRICSVPAAMGDTSMGMDFADNDMIGYRGQANEIVASLPCEILARWRISDLKLLTTMSAKDVQGVSPAGVVLNIPFGETSYNSDEEYLTAIKKGRYKITVVDGQFVKKPFKSSLQVGLGTASFDGMGKVALGYADGLSLIDMVTGANLLPYRNQPSALSHNQLVTLPHSLLPMKKPDFTGFSMQQLVDDVYSVLDSPREHAPNYDDPHFNTTSGEFYVTMKNYESPLLLFSLKTRKLLGTYPNFDMDPRSPYISMSDDAKYIATTVEDKPQLRELAGKKPVVLPKILSKAHIIEISADGKQLAIGGYDVPAPKVDAYGRGSTLFITNVTENRITNKLYPHQGSVVVTHFSHDGHRILSLDQAATLRMWNTQTGSLIYSIPRAGMDALFCDQDRRLLVQVNSIAYDLYDANTGTRLARTWRFNNPETGTMIYATVSKDGRYDAHPQAIKQAWTLEEGHVGLLNKQSLKHTPGLWGLLTK
ncbi:MAG: WD40 repeat domain-containing protein [Armatimonadota bacterium]